MKKKCKVSVVIPVYNVASYLRQCLDSLVNQSFSDFEVICVDDGSTDGSLDILKTYEEKDSRFVVLENKIQGYGAAHARNMGLDHAKGDYVLVLDSDDYFHKELLEQTYHKATETKAEIVLFDAQLFDSKSGASVTSYAILSTDLIPSGVFSARDIPEDIFQIKNGTAWNLFLSSVFLQRTKLIFQPAPLWDDMFFTYRALLLAENITFMREKLLYYRTFNEKSQSQKKNEYPYRGIEMCMDLQAWLKERDMYSTFYQSYSLLAATIVHVFLSELTDYEKFSQLYQRLHFGGLEEIGITNDSLNDENFYFQQMRNVKNYEMSQYLFLQGSTNEVCKLCSEDYISKGESVLLYGAGATGQFYFTENLRKKHCNIVAWLDRDYKAIGFPVTGMEGLECLSFDKILIAIKNKAVAQKAKEAFIKRGVPEEKIIY